MISELGVRMDQTHGFATMVPEHEFECVDLRKQIIRHSKMRDHGSRAGHTRMGSLIVFIQGTRI